MIHFSYFAHFVPALYLCAPPNTDVAEIKGRAASWYTHTLLTYPMDIFHSTAWEVKVDYHIHAFEVDPSRQQSGADKDPNLPRSETLDHILSLSRQKQEFHHIEKPWP